MAKAQSPLLGYNTNVRHKGKVFHIQTEDSGVTRPHVITHLFADGGRVLKTAKTSYAELVGADDLPAQVKKLMQDQHKGMFVALRDGQFDGQFEPAPSHATPAAPLTSAAAVVPSTPVIAAEPATVAPATVESATVESTTIESATIESAPEAALDDDRPTLQVPPPIARPAPIEPETVDLTALASAPDDESAIEVDESQFIEPTESFSIPPDLGEIDLSATIQTPPQAAASAKRSGPWAAAPRAPAPPSPLASATASTRPPPLRPAAARAPVPAVPAVRTRAPAITPAPNAVRAPMTTAAKAAPLATKSSVGFGDRLVSERSLDEVILAYLAEELEDR